MKVVECRSCGAKVLFAVSMNGRNVILDAEPVGEGGNVVLLKAIRLDDKPLALVLSNLSERAHKAAKRQGVAIYLDHHATCPNADEWR